MTTANKITLTRIAMIPFFIYFAAQPMLIIDETRYLAAFPTSTVIALVLFCVASFTDFLDGYVARKYNQVTDFGKFVDPLADKLLVASALILFVEQKAMAGWMVCVILARELIITSLRVVAANKGYFKGKTRFEITLDTPKKIMNYLNLTDTKIFSVLNSDTNPILILFDKIFNNSVTNISNATFDNYEEWSMKIILDSYNGDLKRLEQDVRNKFSSRSGATKRMKKFEAVHHAMTSASTNENLIEKVRNLLL